MLRLWQGSLIAALAVGGFVLGLIVWACFRFRARGDQLPRQVRYNLPVEVLYTVIPVVIVAVLFYFTAIDEDTVDKLSAHPDLRVEVIGFQWSWQFNYPAQGLQITGRPGQPPQLVLPVGETIQFTEVSLDVIHSFWVVPFLFKRDVIPGPRHNQFEVTITKAGVFAGHCAEYCGIGHDQMLFSVRAVSPAQFSSFVARAKAEATSGSPIYTLLPTSSSGSPS